MDHFEDRPGPTGVPELWCEDVRLTEIAGAVGTPVYVYSTATLERHFTVFHDALQTAMPGRRLLVAYAVKANSNVAVIRTLARLGAGADTVSEGEIRRALAAGVPPERIVFSGVGKTDAELAFAIDQGVCEINVEAEAELERLATIAEAKGARPAIAIRVNPDVGAGGHAKISTGKAESKFGVSFSEARRLYARAAASSFLRPVGVACHIGSQITDLTPLEAAFRRMRSLVEDLRADGLNVERLDLGGGLGVPYFDAPEAPPLPSIYAAMVARVLDGLDIDLAFEPGRLIVANAGVLVSTAIHVHRRAEGRRFLVVDAAMNDLLRPTLYEAYHGIRPVRAGNGAPEEATDVVGPVCETGDTFARDRPLPPMAAGDLVAFLSAGAYGASMSSEYNSRPLVPEVLVSGDRFSVIRRRPTFEDMLAREPLPDWLG
jgi:diaminopimelate decarboxylase